MKSSRIIFFLILVLAFSMTVFGQKNKAKAENFSAEAMNGQTVELNSLKGKVVVLTFWSTRCPICESEIPKLNQLASSFKGKDVVFLGLTTDNPVKVENFLKFKPFDFNIIPNSFGVLLKYAERDSSGNVNMGFPAYFVVNQNGEIELKANGWDKTAKITSQINRLLTSAQSKVE